MITPPSMSTIEPQVLSLTVEWQSLAAVVGALLVGLVVGTALRIRSARRQSAAMAVSERERTSLRRVAAELSRTSDVEGVVRALLDEIGGLLGVDFVALSFVSDDGEEASGYLARSHAADVAWWPGVRIDLSREMSGIATAVHSGAGFAVREIDDERVSPRLAAATGAKSAAYIPLITADRVIAVISVATTVERRTFSADELTLMQTLASEATLALERTRSALALAEALERERLVMSIGRRLRNELDLGAALQAAVTQAGRALDATRCFVQVDDGRANPILAQWSADGVAALEEARDLPLSTLAAREARTIAVGDVDDAPELPPEGKRKLRETGVRSMASTPLRTDGAQLGVLTAQRADAGVWTRGELALLEAVAVELGLAIRLGRLIDENRERLGERSALLRAAEVVSGELELTAVLQRLVDEVAALLQADASDCYLYDRERGVLRCAAVHGLDPSLVGFEFSADRGLSGLAIREGRALVATEYSDAADEVPHPAYAGFSDAIVAPMRWSDEVRGVLGVGRRSQRPYGQRDSDVLEAFAALASLALRNAETFSRSARQARIQRGFYRIAAVLGESLSRTATLDAIAQAASEALGGAAAAALMPVGGGGLELTGSHELPEELARVLEQTGAIGTLARSAANGRVVASPNLADDHRIAADWREAAGHAGFGALLSVPVVSPRDGSGGLVAVFFDQMHAFSEDDLELAQHLAGAVRGALERSELYEAERSARSLAQQLARTGRMLTTELDPEAVLDEVVEQARSLLAADAAAIRVLEDGELFVSAARGAGGEQAIGMRSSAGAWLSGDVVQSRAPVALEDAGSDPRLRELDPMLAAGNAAYLGVPLAGSDRSPRGVLSVYSARPRTWRDEEIDALHALAASTSAALANAELYQRVALERERSVAILANVADGIVAVDREGTVVLWNAAAEKITGVPAADAFGRTPFEVLRSNLESDPGAAPEERLISVMRGREEVWLSVSEAVMRDPVGAVSGRIFAFRDISADRLVEQMKSDFVSTVSHELRTPLTSIYGFAETLLRQDVLFGEEERTTFLGYIASESQRLTQIVDALLNVARLDTGDLQVRIAPTDVREVVGEAVIQAGGQNGHSFVVDLPDEPVSANADPEKLLQVFAILLDNAVRYSPAGGKVRVGAECKDDRVQLLVEDEGFGIPLSDQDQIFRKFYRGTDAAARVGAGGTGLGLFIARGLVTAMGGTISVSSREGEGSTFAIELPLAGGPS
jgi:PAS domain S-box-containing protein